MLNKSLKKAIEYKENLRWHIDANTFINLKLTEPTVRPVQKVVLNPAADKSKVKEKRDSDASIGDGDSQVEKKSETDEYEGGESDTEREESEAKSE